MPLRPALLRTNKIFGDQSRFAVAEAEVCQDFRRVVEMEERCGQERRYDDAKWAQRRAKTISEEDILSFLSRKAVIPKYGFPVDVVELDTGFVQQTEETSRVTLQRDLSIAISEFAPTCKVVANKKEWTSYALKKVAEREWERWLYCTEHRFFIKKEHSEESRCCRFMRELVVPRYGFTTCRTEKVMSPRKRSARMFTSRPFFVELLEARPDEINFGNLILTRASPGRLIVICEGYRGDGFYICSSCGAGFRKRERQHNTPYGLPCDGTLEKLSLGHELVTDVVRLRFEIPYPNHDIWFAYSLAYALLEAASEVLEVPSNELSTTVDITKEHYQPSIVIYDNVPGGAGLVARLEQRRTLLDCLEMARCRVDGRCGCAEESSCYGCLRSYRNQFAHVFLKRGTVHQFLGAVLESMRRG